MENNTSTSVNGNTTAAQNNFDYSENEELIKGIVIPNSQFIAKWVKDKGYSVGYENYKLSKDYETLEEALNQIGYGVDKDEAGDEILVKVGDTDWELIVRLMQTMIAINNENNKIEEETEATNG